VHPALTVVHLSGSVLMYALSAVNRTRTATYQWLLVRDARKGLPALKATAVIIYWKTDIRKITYTATATAMTPTPRELTEAPIVSVSRLEMVGY